MIVSYHAYEMATVDERKRRGLDIIKKYRSSCGGDSYAAASDAIVDVLLSISQNSEEAGQILHSAEIEFRSATENEDMLAEG